MSEAIEETTQETTQEAPDTTQDEGAQLEAGDELQPDGTLQAPESRSQRARREREELRKEAAEARDEARKAREESQREAAELRAQLAEMRGYVSAQRETAQRAAEPEVTPAELRKRAREALRDHQDIDTYERLNTEAIKIEVRADIERTLPKQAPPMNPVLNGILMAHPAVIEAGDDGVQITRAKDLLLARKGMPQGPARLKKALEMAEKELLGDVAPKKAYSQANAGVLSGVPVTRTGSSDTEDFGSLVGRLSPQERAIQEKSGMSPKEYIGYMRRKNPERFR